MPFSLFPRAAGSSTLPAQPGSRPWGSPWRILGALSLLAAAGLSVQLGWLVVWTVSYRLTHGNDFTFRYLSTYGRVWERLYDLLRIGNTLAPGLEPPGGTPALDTVVGALVLGFGVVSLGYLAALILLDGGLAEAPGVMGLVLGVALVGQVTLFTLPGVYTTDIFSYVMYGQIAGLYGLNPYIYVPADFPANPIVAWIHPIWHYTPSVYGPLWTMVGWAMARATAALSLVLQVFAYKALMNVVFLASLGLMWWLLGRLAPEDGSRRARVTAFTAFAWNPVMLFEVAGNAHNDGLMVLLLLLALVPLALAARTRSADHVWPAPSIPAATSTRGGREWRWSSSIILVGLSALVKYTSGLVGLFLLAAWVRRTDGWRARLVLPALTGAILAGLTLVLFWPWLQLPQSLAPILGAAGGNNYTNSLPDLLALTVSDQWLDPAGLNRAAAQESARFWMKAVTRVLFAAYLVWEVRRVWQLASSSVQSATTAVLEASVRAFLLLLLGVLTWVLAWYFTWPLALATLLGWRHVLTRVVVGYTLTSLPVFYVHHYWSVNMPGWFLFLYALPPLAVPLAMRIAGRRSRLAGGAGAAPNLEAIAAGGGRPIP